MEVTQEHIRHCLVYEFHRQGEKKDAKAAAAQINEVYGEKTVGVRTAQTWFNKFKKDDFEMEVGHPTGRPDTFSDNEIEEILERNPWATQAEMAAELHVTQPAISNRLHRMGKVPKAGVLVPKVLNFHEKFERSIIGRINLSRYQRNPRFLRHLVVADQTPVFVKNYRRRHAWVDPDQPAPSAERPQKSKKMTLCIFYDMEGILLRELIVGGVTSEIYARQLREVQAALAQRRLRRRKVIILHDNYKPHFSQAAMAVIGEFRWEVLVHPAYSPDGNPVDYSFNRGLKTYQGNKHYENEDELEADVDHYITSKEGTDFYRNSIEQLPTRWQYWYDNEGAYYPD